MLGRAQIGVRKCRETQPNPKWELRLAGEKPVLRRWPWVKTVLKICSEKTAGEGATSFKLGVSGPLCWAVSLGEQGNRVRIESAPALASQEEK